MLMTQIKKIWTLSVLTAILLCPFSLLCQSYSHTFYGATNYTFYQSTNNKAYPIKWNAKRPVKKEDYAGFGASFGYRLEYQFPKILSIATGVGYFYTKAEFQTSCFFCGFHDWKVHSNVISTHSFDVPITIKLRTPNKNQTYLIGSIGVTNLSAANRNVSVQSPNTDGQIESVESVEIVDEPFFLKNGQNNSVGTYYEFGLGQLFHIKKLKILTEISYRNDLNNWIYYAVNPPNGIHQIANQDNAQFGFDIKRQSLLLKLGVLLN